MKQEIISWDITPESACFLYGWQREDGRLHIAGEVHIPAHLLLEIVTKGIKQGSYTITKPQPSQDLLEYARERPID